jgi:hypothetical protein
MEKEIQRVRIVNETFWRAGFYQLINCRRVAPLKLQLECPYNIFKVPGAAKFHRPLCAVG